MKRARKFFRYDNIGYLFVLPAFIYMMIFVGYPIVDNLILSFQQVTIQTLTAAHKPFAGLANYTEIFKDLNLDVPETWEELDTVCDTLKQAGYVPFALGNKNKWPGLLEYTMLGVNLGGQEMSKGLTDRTMSFDNEYFIEAGRRLADFSKKGYYPDGTNGIDHNAGGSRMLFYNEVAAMFIMTNGFLSNCVAEDAEFYEKVGTINSMMLSPLTMMRYYF